MKSTRPFLVHRPSGTGIQIQIQVRIYQDFTLKRCELQLLLRFRAEHGAELRVMFSFRNQTSHDSFVIFRAVCEETRVGPELFALNPYRLKVPVCL